MNDIKYTGVVRRAVRCLPAWLITASLLGAVHAAPIVAPDAPSTPTQSETVTVHRSNEQRPITLTITKQLPEPLSPNVSLLDENQNLKSPVSADQIAQWKLELAQPGILTSRAALLHLWIGEAELAQETDPTDSLSQFEEVLKIASRSTSVYWQANLDESAALLKANRADDAQARLSKTVMSREKQVGVPRTTVIRLFNAVKLQVGYQNHLKAMAIPAGYQTNQILCVDVHLTSTSPTTPYFLKAPHGSTMGDLEKAAKKKGFTSRVLGADDQGLIDLPKPLVAYVERRHFLDVIEADKQGVSYESPGCCANVSQKVRLTWKQWHALDPGLYLSLTYHGSSADRLLTAALAGSHTVAQVAYAGSLSRLGRQANLLSPLAARLSRHVRWIILSLHDVRCGGKPDPPDYDPYRDEFLDSDPVNVATGEEEYSTPAPDFVVYNSQGPSVRWSRYYNSLRAPGENYLGNNSPDYQCADYGVGWSQSYNVEVYDPSNGDISGTIDRYVVFPNGSRFPFTATTTPSTGTPVVHCSVALGHPVMVDWDYDGSTLGHYTITFPDRTKWVTNGVNTASCCYSLASIQDRNGNLISFSYSTPSGYPGRPLLSAINGAGGTLLTIQRAQDGTGNIMSVSDCYGRTFYYHVGPVATYNVANGYPQYYQELDHVSQIAPTNSIPSPDLYVYTYQNWPNAINNSNGPEAVPYLYTVSSPSPAGPAGQMSTMTFNEDPNTCRITSVVDANGNVRTYTPCDQYGNIPANPVLISNYTLVQVSNSGRIVSSAVVGFDNYGALQSLTDGAAHTIYQVTQWDAVSQTKPAQTEDGNGHLTNYTWDAYGNLLSDTTPRGDIYTVGYQYNPDFTIGQLQSITHTSSGSVSQTPTSFTYYQPTDGHLNGFLKTVSSPVPGTTGSSSTVTTTFTYDALGDLLTSTSTAANNATSSFTTTYNYTSDPTYGVSLTGPNLGEPLTVTDNLGHTAHYQYNTYIAAYPVPGSWLLGQPTRVEDALGNTTDIAYNIAGQPFMTVLPATGETGTGRGYILNSYLFPGSVCTSTQVYNEQNTATPTYPSTYTAIRQTNYTYGSMGELLSTAIFNPSTSSAQTVQTRTYDADYRITSLADGNSNTSLYYYNQAGYLAAVTFPGYTGNAYPYIAGADSLSYPSYDGAGNPLERVDGRGIATDYVYSDPESRLTDIEYPSNSTDNIHLTYDGFGRLSTKTDGTEGLLGTGETVLTAGVTYAYDDLDEATSISTNFDAPTSGFLPTQTIGYSYYSDGSLETESTPAGSFSYLYDGGGRLTSITNPYSETTSYAYQNNNWPQSVTSVPATTSYTLDALGKLIGQTTVHGATTLLSYGTFNYDGEGNDLGNAASITGEAAYSGSEAYGYDYRDTLTTSSGTQSAQPTSTTYSSDPAYNLTTLRGSSLSYNADNQLSGTSFAYDGSGNPTTYESDTLTFDEENRLTTVQSGGSTLLTAGYSGLNRVWKQNNAGTRTYFLYDGSNPVCELNSSGTVIATNTFGPDGLVSRYSGSSSTFYQSDPQGNPTLRLSSTGSVIGAGVFDPYGVHTTSDSSTDPYSGYHGVEGYYSDQETGLQLLGARYYDSGMGRFLTRDPIGYLGGPNPYAYCMGDPIGGSDPLGLSSATDPTVYDPAFNPSGDALHAANNWINNNLVLHDLSYVSPIVEANPVKMLTSLEDTFDSTVNAGYGLQTNKGDQLSNAIAFELGWMQMAMMLLTEEGGGCFVAGTPVQMANSTVAIENVHDGDKIISRDPATGKTEIKTVLNTTVHQVHDLVVLHFAIKKHGKEIDTVTTTPPHPFYVAGKGFVPAGQLAVGSSIVTHAGAAVVIIKIEKVHLEKSVPVYNLTVDGDHTYFIGSAHGGEWVHNADNCTKIAQGLQDAGTPGEIYRLEPDPAQFARPDRMDLGNGRGWNYHDVLYDADNGQVYDPMTYGNSDPVPFDTWSQNFPYWDVYQWGPKP